MTEPHSACILSQDEQKNKIHRLKKSQQKFILHPVYIKSHIRTYLVKYNLNIKDKISDSETASITEFEESGQRVIRPAPRKPSYVCFPLPSVFVRVFDELRRRRVVTLAS